MISIQRLFVSGQMRWIVTFRNSPRRPQRRVVAARVVPGLVFIVDIEWGCDETHQERHDIVVIPFLHQAIQVQSRSGRRHGFGQFHAGFGSDALRPWPVAGTLGQVLHEHFAGIEPGRFAFGGLRLNDREAETGGLDVSQAV